ncbi:hyaluronan-binding protein 2-like [Eurytemora carolleeae]|uniref:hyaluronan-binding protein 2-like n=1 Tax=Eurytemora carolleeae TaxID=1294199 RepID=UPI000C76B7B8|nr:hyaluronan-binding protein 2-like [Eurytemora carolleeae]|eukprot:XP_023332595.1 hyaluronan-binding protein 2-like [Eurytemora affinis]
MPTWGLCDGACVVEMDENGQFAFESLSGVSFWAEQYLISYKDCFKYLKGMTGSKDPKLLENFDPKTELCAGKIFKLRLQNFKVDNLTITRENIQGSSTQIGEPTNPLPHFIGGTDTCQGDSGGPLWRWQALQKNSTEERVVQIGIIARGDKCARVNRPGIYTKLSSFRKWIKKNTQDGECDKFE